MGHDAIEGGQSTKGIVTNIKMSDLLSDAWSDKMMQGPEVKAWVANQATEHADSIARAFHEEFKK